MKTIEELEMVLTNPDEIRSRRDYNKYIIEYKSNYNFQTLKQHLLVETAVNISSFPVSNMETECYIYEYLLSQNRNDIVNQYDLETFLIKVQDMNRTFIDKVFAIGDYYLDGRIWGHSRYIYDLHKIYPFLIFYDAFKNLVNEVRMTRKLQKVCLSALDYPLIN